MPNVFFRAKPTRLPPADVAARLVPVLADALPGAAVDVAVGEGRTVVVSWEDGPSAGAVADVVAGVVNWEVRTPAAPAGDPAAPAVVLARRFSERALAVAVVRYQASNVRPYDSASPRAVAGLVELLEVDDPQRSGYPVADAVADLLLAAPDPDDLAERAGADASPADRLAAKLTALGYDRLWSVAWSSLR